ncbi:hypothetical protein [Spirillospora sp. NPDC048823]|uniref:hypothetical protein n=1 Tax=unclassified Spirillospora TaxID=2642701 RepID=UPI00371319F1
MGVEDTTKTDTRTETSDKPTSQERPSAPPPDNPGSPGQPSRLESLRRAREQQEARAQQAQEKDTGSSPREQRDDETTSEQPGRAAENAEASGRPGAKDKQQRQDEDQREDDPRIQDQGTSGSRETDTGTPGDRNHDRPQAQPAEPRADTRTEPAERPTSPERQWTPPPDNPGSPGQPSRLESLARAREQQQAAAAQRNESSDTGSRPTEQRDHESATPQLENDGVKAEPAGNAEGADENQDADTPTDDAKTEDEPKPDTSEAPPTHEHNLRDADKPTDHARQPTGETTDQPTGPQEPRPGTTTGELDSQDRTTDPPRTAEQGIQITDGPTDNADQPRPESAEQPTPLADGTDQPHPTDTIEADDPATAERPDASALAEPDREAAGQPAERPQAVADDDDDSAPGGAAAPDLGRERDDAEPAGEDEEPEPSPVDEDDANEIPDGSGDDNDDHDRNAEEQPESPASQEDNPVTYRIRTPDGEQFGPPGTDRWVYHRGRLDPVDENQDLSEPDPEKSDSPTRLFRALRESPDDVQKHLNGIGSDLAEAAPEQAPRGNPTTSQDTRAQPDAPQHQAAPQVGDIMYAAAATAFIAFVVKQKISEGIARRRGGDNEDNR